MEIGVHKVKITSNTIAELGGKPAVKVNVRFEDGEEAGVLIWMTEKAAGIARAQLKICGFNVDDEPLSNLIDNPERLRGKEIDVLCEEWNGNIRAQIALNTTPADKEVSRLEKLLRGAKKGNAPSREPGSDDDFPPDVVKNPISGKPMEPVALSKLGDEEDVPVRKAK